MDAVTADLSQDIANTPTGTGEFVGHETRRTHTVLVNSSTAVALHPTIAALNDVKVASPLIVLDHGRSLWSSMIASFGIAMILAYNDARAASTPHFSARPSAVNIVSETGRPVGHRCIRRPAMTILCRIAASR